MFYVCLVSSISDCFPGKTLLVLPLPTLMFSTQVHDSIQRLDWNRGLLCVPPHGPDSKGMGEEKRQRHWWSLQRREVLPPSLFTRSGAFYYMSLITTASLISSQHALSPQVIPLCLRKRSRLAVCCCHGNQAAMVCLPSDTTPSSTESCPTAIGQSTRHRSTMRPHHIS